jgi:hypothetical protein
MMAGPQSAGQTSAAFRSQSSHPSAFHPNRPRLNGTTNSISPHSTNHFRYALTLTHPISAAFSLNACRLMFRPYLRINPDFFFSPFTTLCLSVLVHAEMAEYRTSCGCLCRMCVGASSIRFRETLCFVKTENGGRRGFWMS